MTLGAHKERDGGAGPDRPGAGRRLARRLALPSGIQWGILTCVRLGTRGASMNDDNVVAGGSWIGEPLSFRWARAMHGRAWNCLKTDWSKR